MSSDPNSNTRDLLREAACEAFYEYGYDGSSVREIASRRGVTVAALYHHFPSKGYLLADVIVHFMEDVLEAVEGAAAGAPEGARNRLSAAVNRHVLFLTERPIEGFVANAEIRSLTGDDYERALDAQRRHQHCYEGILQEGAEKGEFDVRNVGITARAIMSMCTAILSWFRGGEGYSAEEIARMYSDLALKLGCSPDAEAAGFGGGARNG